MRSNTRQNDITSEIPSKIVCNNKTIELMMIFLLKSSQHCLPIFAHSSLRYHYQH